MDKISLQIQSILYNHHLDDLKRSLESLARAIEINRNENGIIKSVELCYGDSSSLPLFNEKELAWVNARYSPFFQLNYVFFDGNLGTAKGHNSLGSNCSADYMLIMNPEIIMAPDTLTELFRPFLESQSRIGIVEARQTPIEHPKEYNIINGETGWASTACVLFPVSLFKELNGFDAESFFLYCDDLDFSWRARLNGYKIIYQPSAMVFHAKRLTTSGRWTTTQAERYYSAEAALFMAHKWSYPERVKLLLRNFKQSDDENAQKAAAVFEKREAAGTLPQPIDKEHKVAKFIGDNYSKHRFEL